jgi:hypothetical protein
MRHRHTTDAHENHAQGHGLALLVALFFILPGTIAAQQATEYQVKAAYLFNFAKFVKWPPASAEASGEGTFDICVIGHDPFGGALEAIAGGEKINGKAVTTKHVSSPKEAVGCRIIFVSSSEDARVKRLLSDLDKGAVLTVSDMPHFLEKGGMIQFVPQGNRVRFEVNLTAAEKAGLTVSSELLKVATNVRKES